MSEEFKEDSGQDNNLKAKLQILRRRRISHRELRFLNHSVLSTVTSEAFSLATIMPLYILAGQ